jgi:shikimate dehydrogenase
MHAAAYRSLHMPHRYEALRVPTEELPARLEQLRRGVYAGFNVTVPHKQEALRLADEAHVSARLVGAANTLVRGPQGQVVAYNTDAPAITEELRGLAAERGAHWSGTSVLVLGTGGAARAAIVAAGLDLRVQRVWVRGRDANKARALAQEMQGLLRDAGASAVVLGGPLEAVTEDERHVVAVVQGTSAGMTGKDSGEAVAEGLAWEDLPADAVAMDVVYAPSETPCLTYARNHGLRSTNGLGMLARQGALAFQLWLGGPPPYNAMLTALV